MRQPDEQPAEEKRGGAIDRRLAGSSSLDFGLLVLCVTLPVCLAMAHTANAADAAHDEGVVRAVGFGWTGALRALDAPWCALFAWVPLGTRALRASLASAMACGVGGGVVFVLARALAERAIEGSRVAPVVAAIASLATTLSPAWVLEAMAPAGGTPGGVLVLAPLALAVAGRLDLEARVVGTALATGLAVSYEPLVGLAALASLGLWGAMADEVRLRDLTRSTMVRAFVGFGVGCAPFALAFGRRVSELATNASVFAQAAGERGESVAGMPASFARDDLGVVSCVAIVAGTVIACLSPRARGVALSATALVVVGVIAMLCGASAGPTRYGAPVLGAVGGAYVLAAVAMQAIVRAVSEARIPFAQASAVMILVLEMALPARAADDSSARADLRTAEATRAWDDVAFGALPSGAALLVETPRVEMRLLAARAAGEMRADVALVPLFDLAGHAAMRELARDVKLESLWHDATLVGPPQEWSLSSLASWRPLVAPYDPGWDRALARHFVPIGLFARFEPEPRGASDRRRALDDFAATRTPLARALEADPELLALTASLLRARAITLATTSERDVVERALDDLRPFSPRDPVAIEIVRRLAASRGAIDVTDLK